MPIISDISHNIATTESYSHDLEVQWSPINLGCAVKVLSFDRLGRFCAVYAEDRVIRLCDVRTALLPMTLLPLSQSISRYESNCLAMAWSQCGHFLAASFSRQYPKRKFHVEHSSIIAIWHVPTQRVVYKISVPITASYLHIAPSVDLQHPSFIAGSQYSPHMLVLDAFHGVITVLDGAQQITQQLPVAVIPTVDVAEMETIAFTYAFATDTTSNATIITDTPSKEDNTEYRYVCQYQSDERDVSVISGARLLCCKYSDSQQVCSLSSIDFSLATEKPSPSLLIIRDIDTVAITNVQRLHQVSLNPEQSKLLVAVVDRIFVFSLSRIGEGFLHEEQSTSSTCNMLTQVNYAARSVLHLTAEFYGFPRHSRMASADFFSRKFDLSRKQNGSNVECILIITSHQVDRLHTSSELLFWDYQCQEKVVNNKLVTVFSKSNHLVVLPNALLCSELFIQPILPKHNELQRQKPQGLFALDTENKLWSCANLYWSKFPGPMYPIGYTLIQQVKPYVETEEELDIKIIPSKRSIIEKEQTIKQEVPVSARTLPLSCIASPINTKYATYLVKLPLSLQAFIAKNSNKRQGTNSWSADVMASPSAKQVEEVASPSFASPNDTSNKNLTVEITAEIMEVTEGHTTNDLEDNMSTNNADAKREVFSSSLKSYLPIPTRVLAGDFELKVQRDRTLSDAIQVAVANTSLATEKIQQLKQEALRYAIKKFVSKERSKMNMEEKKRQRMQKKDELLKSIFSAAIEREQEEALRRDVKRVIDKMLRACELQLNATAVKNNNSSSSSSILPTKPPTVAGKAIPVPPAAMETEKTNIVEVKVESVIYTPISAIPPPLPITMEIVTTTEVKEIATLTVKEE